MSVCLLTGGDRNYSHPCARSRHCCLHSFQMVLFCLMNSAQYLIGILCRHKMVTSPTHTLLQILSFTLHSTSLVSSHHVRGSLHFISRLHWWPPFSCCSLKLVQDSGGSPQGSLDLFIFSLLYYYFISMPILKSVFSCVLSLHSYCRRQMVPTVTNQEGRYSAYCSLLARREVFPTLSPGELSRNNSVCSRDLIHS